MIGLSLKNLSVTPAAASKQKQYFTAILVQLISRLTCPGDYFYFYIFATTEATMTTDDLAFTPLQTAAIPLNPTLPTKPKGYHKLAALMGPNTEVAIFRRFGALNTLNLLGLQSELVDLEAQLSDISREDDTSDDPNRATYSERFWVLRESLEDGDDLQWQTQLNIRRKLLEYSRIFLRRFTESEYEQLM